MKRKLKCMWFRGEFFEVGLNLMSDSLDIHLIYWTFSVYLTSGEDFEWWRTDD